MYLTAKQVQDKFKISRTTYYRWIREHKLPYPITLGRVKCFDADSIKKAEQLLKAISEKNLIKVTA